MHVPGLEVAFPWKPNAPNEVPNATWDRSVA